MDIRTWIGCNEVTIFPWVDGKNIYINVIGHRYGASIHATPMYDKSALVEDTEWGRNLVYNFTHTIVEYIEQLKVPENARFIVIKEGK